MNHPVPHLPAPRLHPALLAAALSVSAFSLAGIGVMTGTFPPSAHSSAAVATSTPATAPATVAAPVAPAATRSAPAPRADRPAAKSVRQEAQRQETVVRHDGADIEVSSGHGNRAYKTAAPVVCHECGVVEAVREAKVDGEGTGLGAVGGAVLGGLIGSNIGGGRGNDLAKIVGVVGGGYAGHQIEKNARSQTRYEIVVRFEDGTTQVVTQNTPPTWRQGDRVRMRNGTLAGDA